MAFIYVEMKECTWSTVFSSRHHTFWEFEIGSEKNKSLIREPEIKMEVERIEQALLRERPDPQV